MREQPGVTTGSTTAAVEPGLGFDSFPAASTERLPWNTAALVILLASGVAWLVVGVLIAALT